MKRSTVGALLLLLLGLVSLGVAYVVAPLLQSRQQVATSDAANAKGGITIGMDSFAGYFPLCSPVMRQLMLADGYKLDCVDDKADTAGRFARLAQKQLDFAVATVDSFVLAGRPVNYPGVIVAVLDESKGGDAIVARAEAVASLEDLKHRSGLAVAYTPNSPSHHLLKAVGVHFDVPLFRGGDPAARRETAGSPEALAKLLSGEAQVAVLWEPDVSKALAQPGVVKLLGSDQTARLIVDILVAGRDLQDRYPERVQLVLGNYFKALKVYRDDPARLQSDLAAYAGVTPEIAGRMAKGIAWAGLQDNASLWLGLAAPGSVPTHGLFDTIDATMRILREVGDIADSPLPGGDPRRVINSRAVATLFTQGITPATGTAFLAQPAAGPLQADFPALDAAGWERLRGIGALKVRPILFRSGTAELSLEDKRELDAAAEALKSYPNFRIEVQGHSKPGADEQANVQLSQERAEAVARYLQITYDTDPDRLRAVGLGSARPLPRQGGEAYRAWQDRLSRVEIHLRGEAY